MKPRRSEKLPNSGLYTALFAPIGSGAPTCAITTPISPAGTCTHGNFFTPKIGHSLNAQPRHQQLGLVAGLAVERDRVVLGQLAQARSAS